MGIERGRRRLGGLLCAIATLLAACGETSQRPGDLEKAGQAGQTGGGGSSAGAPAPAGQTSQGGSSAGSAGVASGGLQSQSENCPQLQPRAGSACTEGQRCFYPGSVSPCAPPDASYTCKAGSWSVQYGAQNGTICLEEACSGLNPATRCPPLAPTQGSSCLPCSPTASCQYGELTAVCGAGLWQVTGSANAGAAGAGGEGGAR